MQGAAKGKNSERAVKRRTKKPLSKESTGPNSVDFLRASE